MADAGPSPEERLREAYKAQLRRRGDDLPFADHRPGDPVNLFPGGVFNPNAAKASIRRLEDEREYTAFRTVGTEPRADFLYRLATVRARKGPYLGDRLPHFQAVLDDQMREITGWLAQQGVRLPFPVFVGVFPSKEVNARAVAQEGLGALILVNIGLMHLIFTALKANIATASSGPEDPPLLAREQATMVLAEAFNDYLYGDGSLLSWGLPRLPAGREAVLGLVLRRAEQFVIAHEVGHVACGHVSIAGDGANASGSTPEREFEADRFAVTLMAASLRPGGPGEEAPFLAGGILTFVAVAAAVNALRLGLALPDRDTGSHPALSERGERLVTLLRERLDGPDTIGRAALFAGWLGMHLPGVLQWLKLVEETMTRPSRLG